MQVLLCLYFLSICFLVFYGFHRSSLLLTIFLSSSKPLKRKDLKEFPLVCIQLPMYNEKEVAKRVIKAVSEFDYPIDKLEIQVVDDSNDKSKEIIDKEVGLYQKKGINIKTIRREDREGFKAGALKNAMNFTNAEYIAVFDADFLPNKDFLKETLPYFVEDNIAFIQTRWGHINKEQNLLTKAQSILIDGHFVIEHTARHRVANFNFNGTAGIWRKEAIISAGNWEGDTLTEDLDLSYRAFLKGWKAVYLKDVICPAELPSDIAGFKSQQFRWMKGSAQVMKKLLIPILKSNLSFREKLEGFFHLTAHLCYIHMLITAILLIPISIYRSSISFVIGTWFEVLILISLLGSMFFFYISSQALQKKKVKFLQIMLAIILAIGISFHCAIASLSGLFSGIGEFVRTPKKGLTSSSSSLFRFEFVRLRNHKKECLMAVYLFLGMMYLLTNQGISTLPFALLLFGGYFLVCLSAFQDSK